MNPVEKFIELRKESGLSQAKFAKKLDISVSPINNVESGKVKQIPSDLAYALEKEYNIPFKWWKTGEGPMTMEKTYEQLIDEAYAQIDDETLKDFAALYGRALDLDLDAIDALEQELKTLRKAAERKKK